MTWGLPVAILLAVAAALAGCTALEAPTLADSTLEYVRQVCATPAADRAELLAELDQAARPFTIAIDCGSGVSR